MRLNHYEKIRFFTAVTLLSVSGLAWGQNCPDFKGTWVSYGELPMTQNSDGAYVPGGSYKCTFNTASDGTIVVPSGCDSWDASGNPGFGGGATGQ